jgi:hypothetical protein
MSDRLHDHPAEQREKPPSPFEREREVMMDDLALNQDDISAAQTDARAAARLSGEHEIGLLGNPNAEGAFSYPASAVRETGVSHESD